MRDEQLRADLAAMSLRLAQARREDQERVAELEGRVDFLEALLFEHIGCPNLADIAERSA